MSKDQVLEALSQFYAGVVRHENGGLSYNLMMEAERLGRANIEQFRAEGEITVDIDSHAVVLKTDGVAFTLETGTLPRELSDKLRHELAGYLSRKDVRLDEAV